MHSMTGYGKGVSKRDGKTITIEIKTVNHRFLDCNIKLPRNFLFVEDRVKKAVSSAISRGHVDLYLTYEQSSTDEGAYTVDLELANNYLTAVRQLENSFNAFARRGYRDKTTIRRGRGFACGNDARSGQRSTCQSQSYA